MFFKMRSVASKTAIVLAPTHAFKIVTQSLFLLFLASCILPSKIEVNIKSPIGNGSSPRATVTNIQIINNQIVIDGTNLNTVSDFQIKDGSNVIQLAIESKNSTSLTANTVSNVTLSAGKVFNFIVSNNSESSSYTIDFSLCNSLLGGKGISCATPIQNQVFSYSQTSGKWEPRLMNGLIYQGTWDATTSTPVTGALHPGDYYVVSVANPPYQVGDWLVLNDSMVFERFANSTVVASMYGRHGDIVATEGDYDLDKMTDVILAGKQSGDTLRFDGTHWVPAPFTIKAVTQVSVTPPLLVTNATTTPAISLSAADGSTNGYLKSSDWTIFNNKENAVVSPTSPTTKYYRGDKSFATLDTSAVTENTNLYFTNARALAVPLTSLDVLTAGSITDGDTVLEAFGKTQQQINSINTVTGSYLFKSAADTLSGAVSLTGTITTSGAGDFIITGAPATSDSLVNKAYVDLKAAKTGDTMSGVLTLDSDLKMKGGSHYVTIKGNAATASDYTIALPANAGTAGDILSTNGSGATSWVNPPGAGPVGTVTSVTANAPLVVANGTVTPVISLPAATATDDGYLTSANWSTFNTKEPAIVAPTDDATKKYYRGDKTFTTIDTNVLGSILTGLDTTLTGSIVDGDSVVQAFGKTQHQLNTLTSNGAAYLRKNSTDAITGVVSVPATGSLLITYTPTDASDAINKTYIETKIAKTGDTITGVISLDNDLKIKSGSNYVTLKGSATTASDYSLTLPIDAGTSGYVLKTDGNGVTSWVAQTAVNAASAFGRTGAVVAVAGDYTAAQVTNVAAGNITATTVQAALNELDTEKQNASGMDAYVRGVLLDGLSLATSTVIAATDSILSAFGNLQGQVTALATSLSNKVPLTDATQAFVVQSITATAAPSDANSGTNKLYVDGKSAQNLFYQSVSANYSVVAADNSKVFNVTNASIITLPAVATVPAGFMVYVKQTGTSSPTVNTTSSQTIDGQASIILEGKNSIYLFVNTGSEWAIGSKYTPPAKLSATPMSLTGLDAYTSSYGTCQNVTIVNTGSRATSALTIIVSSGFTKNGCVDVCTGVTLKNLDMCTVGFRTQIGNPAGPITGTLTASAVIGGSVVVSLSGTISSDPCFSSPTPGTVCAGGAIYLGSLSPGATSGSGTDKYMTTPGGCGQIPAEQIVGSGASAYPSADFTPTCSGTDILEKTWNNGTTNWAVVSGLTDYTTTGGTGQGAINTDLNYGSTNTTNIAAVTAGASGGYHAAARYCDKLNYGGYTDWYLPNRHELNLMWTNKTSIPGLDTGGPYWYWSSTEYSSRHSWIQRFSDGYQLDGADKDGAHYVRCVRRF